MFEVWRTETWGDRIHWSSVFSASRSGVLWKQDLHKGRVSLHQIQWPLFCDYPHLLSVTGVPWDGPFLSGTHRHCCGEATDPGRGGNLVDCGHCSPSEWDVDTRWWQQLGAILLKQRSQKTIFETPVCFNMLKACFFFLQFLLKTANIQMAIMIQLYVINVGRKMWNWPRNENDHVGPIIS